jgi:hypothetical protein
MRTLRRMSIEVVLTLGLVVPLATGLGRVDAASDPFEAMGVDRVAKPAPGPDLRFRSLDGHEVRLREFQGKAVLLGFFRTD